MKAWVLLLGVLLSCQKEKSPEQREQIVEVTTYVVQPQEIAVDFSLVGVVQSSHQVQILSAVQGELQKIAFTEGAFVHEGDLLFQIDARRFAAKVVEAQANLQAAEANFSSAQETKNRIVPLEKQGAASQKDLDDAEAALLTAQASVSKAKAELDEANLNLSNTSIVSPISGYTAAAQFQEGSLILPGGSALTSVSVIDPVYVELSSSEGLYLKNLNEAARGELILPENNDFEVTLTLNGEPFPTKGKVSFVSPIFKADMGTLTSRAIFPNPGNLLKPGLFVTASLHGAKRPHALLVPQEAVQQGATGFFVYVVDSENRAEMRPINVGDLHQEYWIVSSGLIPGDRVIVSGVQKLKNGTPVKRKKQ